jgi:hypothetical protein
MPVEIRDRTICTFWVILFRAYLNHTYFRR